MQTVTLFKNNFKKEESRNIDREIALEKRIKQLDNIVLKRDQSAQTKAQQLEPKLYDGNVIKNTSAIVIPDSEETIILAEESRSKMLLKQKDPMMLEKKVITTPVDYANSVNSLDHTPSNRPTKVKVSKELHKVSMVNTSLKKLNHHLVSFDMLIKERTTPTTITEGSWRFEHIKACFRDEIIPFVKALKDLFNTFDQYLIDEIFEVQNVFHQMEQAVEQHRLKSKTFEVKMNQVLNNNERLLEQVINKDIVNIIMYSFVEHASMNVHECKKCLKLKTELQEKDTVIKKLKERIISLSENMNDDKIKKEKVLVITALKDGLRKLKGKDLVDNAVTKHTIDPKMLKIDVEPITPKLLNLRTTHSVYIKHIKKKLQFLGIYQTCPSINNSGEKLVAVTPKIKDKRVRFTEPVTSSGNTKTTSSSNLVSNKPMLSSTGVRPFTSASRSQPSGNNKKNKIQRPSSSTLKNKVKAHSRTVKSSLKHKNCVVKPKETTNVQHSKINANSKLLCVKCNGCMLSANHDLCVRDFINNVNARAKSKSVKKSSKQKVWKPTGKVFTNIGYSWRPTGRTFTIIGNACPLTRITTTAEVPLRKPTTLECDTSKPVVTLVYSRKPRKSKTNVPVSKAKIIKSVSANKMEPSKSWGFIVSDVLASSLNECRSSKLFSVKFGNDHVAKILGYGDYQIGNVTILRVYYMEGLGHNLFSLGQFCDSNLKVAFRQHTCFIRNLEGVDLLIGSRGNNLYTMSLGDMMASSPICLLLKASKTKSKDEAPDFIIKFLKMIQVLLKTHVRRIRTENGTEFVNQTLREYYEKVGISHETYVARSPQQNGVVERRNRTLIEAARTMLICEKAPLFLWAKAVSTECYTQNHSIIRLRHGKTPYELLHDKLHDLLLFDVFGALCYPMNDSENLDFDELTTMASEHSSSGPVLHELTPITISSRLVPNPPTSTLVDRPTPEVIALIAEVVAPVPVASTGSPSLITIDQDAPSPNVAHINNDPFFGIPILENDYEASLSSDVIPTIVHTIAPNSEHVTK
ncbi:retrovirus-related pol polyprotein from transposon TNT 1-94 [Tanacetum coccineum]